MDEDDRDYFENEEIIEAVERFNRMILDARFEYFDVFEIEGSIDYFLDEGEISLAHQAVTNGLEIHPQSISLQIKKAQILLIDGQAEEPPVVAPRHGDQRRAGHRTRYLQVAQPRADCGVAQGIGRA